MSYINYLNIAKALNIKRGDKLFVSSDITRLAVSCFQNNERFDGNLFIDSLLNQIGGEGTLVFPTYNWDFCKGETFVYSGTKSKVGALTNAALKRRDFTRTPHPIYSFAVWGADCDSLCSMKNISSFGADSPFAYFYDKAFKQLFIDVDYTDSATFIHYCEEKIGVPYRFLKNFTANYTDSAGATAERTYSMYVRYLEKNVETNINPMHNIFMKNKAVGNFDINDINYRMLDLRAAYELVEHDIKFNKSRNLVAYEGQNDE